MSQRERPWISNLPSNAASPTIALQFGVVALLSSRDNDDRSECSPAPPRLLVLLAELPILQLLTRLLLDSVPWLPKSPLPFPAQFTAAPCPPPLEYAGLPVVRSWDGERRRMSLIFCDLWSFVLLPWQLLLLLWFRFSASEEAGRLVLISRKGRSNCDS